MSNIKPFANLEGADLRGADLTRVNLEGANLVGANLVWAKLWAANLVDANLRGANLRGTDLRGANLKGADLGKTCLDSNNIPNAGYTALLMAGFRIEMVDGISWVYGVRTEIGQLNGTLYKTGMYHAPVFSTCAYTDCHPGLYIAPNKEWIREYYGFNLTCVPCRARLSDVQFAVDKFRARELEIL